MINFATLTLLATMEMIQVEVQYEVCTSMFTEVTTRLEVCHFWNVGASNILDLISTLDIEDCGHQDQIPYRELSRVSRGCHIGQFPLPHVTNGIL